MKTLKSILVIGIILMASFVTPVNAQWVEAYTNAGAFYGFHFADSLNGWFSHIGSQKIIHTSDGGYTFNVQLNIALPFNMYDVYMEDNLTGWACGGNSGAGPIYRTTNGGGEWFQVTHPASMSIWGQIEQVGSSIWFFGTYAGATEYMLIMKTSDSGTTWDLNAYPQIVSPAGIHVIDAMNFIVYGVNGLLSRTTDGGNSWILTNLPTDYQVQRVVFLDNNIGYALVANIWSNPTDAYLYRTVDGGFTWNLHYSWVDQGSKEGLSVIPETGTIFVAGYLNGAMTLRGILKSSNGGESWDTVAEVPSVLIGIHTPDILHGWVAGGGKIYRYDYVVPPTIQPISNKLIQFGESFNYQVEATGMGLEYSMTGNPQGLSIGNYSGLINGVPTEGGKFDITVAVQDTDANVVNEAFRLKVNRKPHFLPPLPPTHAWVDSIYQFMLRVEDADDDTISFAAIQLPSFIQLIQNPPLPTALLKGTPAITDTGYHNVSIIVNDGYGGSDTLNFILQVTEYLPLFISPIPDQLIQFGQLFNYQVQASGLGLRYFLSGQPNGLNIGLYSGLISGTPSQVGLFDITVTIQDTISNTANTTFALRINRKPQFIQPYPPEFARVDSLYEGLLSVSDEDDDSLVFTAVQKPDFLELISNPPSPNYTALLQGTPSIADTGSHNISILVSDIYGGEDTLNYTLAVDIITGINPTPELPTEFILYQNYPNPFNPVTKIKFAIPSVTLRQAQGDIWVSLKVYDILGNELAILVDEYTPAGTYEIEFSASGLASGIYFYKLAAGEYSDIKKLILLR